MRSMAEINLQTSQNSDIDFEGVFWKDKFYKSSENQAGLFEMKGNLFQQFLLIYKSEFVSDQQIKSGLWHLTKEAAQIHLDALLSFTKK